MIPIRIFSVTDNFVKCDCFIQDKYEIRTFPRLLFGDVIIGDYYELNIHLEIGLMKVDIIKASIDYSNLFDIEDKWNTLKS